MSINRGPHSLKFRSSGLVYRAALEILEVNIAPHPSFTMKAFSGGSRGAKPKSAKDATRYLYSQAGALSSYFSSTREITNAHGKYLQRGGPLPEGHYTCRYIAHKPGFGECIKLDMWSDAIANSPHFGKKHHHRDGFLIHGRGPKGNDGCIVPEDESKRRLLNRYVKERGTVVLLVKDVGYQTPAEMDSGLA